MFIFKLIELMDKFKKIFLFLLELEEQTHVHLKIKKISKMVNMKNSTVHTSLKGGLHITFVWFCIGHNF